VNNVVVRKYAYNPDGKLIGELDAQGNLLKTFIYASKSHVPDYFIDQNNELFKIIVDQLGSIRLVVKASTGEVVQKMNHDEFGKVLEDSNPGFTPFGFAGGLYDSETKLVRFGARDYDSETGRWLSKDPIRFNGGDANLYGYVLQDPINKIDPPGTGPVAGITCYAADAMYAGGELLAILINYSSEINAYQQQINNTQQQLNNIPSGGNSCDKNSTERSRLNGQLDILSRQKNLALGQLTNGLTGIGGGTLAGGIICTGLLALPIP
jgi:RHS repeat-associated protein